MKSIVTFIRIGDKMYHTSKYETLCKTPSDIFEHLPILKKYADECDSVYELGVRSIVSTWAFVNSNCTKIISVDIRHPKVHGQSFDQVIASCAALGKTFVFIESSSLEVTTEPVDLTFIDTLHVHDLCIEELRKYSKITSKYIIMHDTKLFGESGEMPGTLGLNHSIRQFLNETADWYVKEKFENNNGLTVLARIT